VDLADVAHELYGLLPGDFTAERDSRAKDLKSEDAGLARLVKALPKPTTAAWLVNQLVRHHGDEVEQVARIGAALREAQEGLEKDQLLQLNKQRHAVLRAVTRQARALANELGKPVSTAIADEVEQTLRAVMSDPDAADAVRSGALLRSLSGTGFGPVDLTEAVAVPDAESGGRRPAPRAAKPRPAAKHGATRDAGVTDELADRRRQHEQEEKERERQREERERAERARAEARRQADEAEEEASRADDALDDAQAVVEELDGRAEGFSQRLHELERQIRDAQNELAAVQREQKTAQRDRDEARHDSEAAHRALDRARQRVERLT
jgi:DNA repair exonuclease SbcCD ATPase subunit